ncbi:MAG TPA: formylglycine-generating enzyme family protein [Gammaproteobacteria bacterium]|nr:formylglycine-generating enzyme family protein [Gammaproteobacteria bacterium]
MALSFTLFLSAALAAAAGPRPADHLHSEQGCIRCHSEGMDTARLIADSRAGCQRCHRAGGAAPAVSVAPGEEPEMEAGTLAADAGMSLPLYYEDSRLGAEPNSMVRIPAGPFIMGTDERLSDEGPQHVVDLPAFWIDRYEVTNLQYKKYIDEAGRRSPRHFVNRTYPRGKADHPVTFVNWYDARNYCQWAGKRLPTDAEWEKAARGTDGRRFPWGNEFGLPRANTPVRWAAIGQPGDTTPVGAFESGQSPYGVYDMAGNVWEWTASWYEAYPGNHTPSENYGKRYKTLKGGSWFDCSFYKCGISAPVYNRAFFSRKTKNDTFGFRCAKDAAAEHALSSTPSAKRSQGEKK